VEAGGRKDRGRVTNRASAFACPGTDQFTLELAQAAEPPISVLI
jgi:hypothetical protein